MRRAALAVLILACPRGFALDLWRYPEMAAKHALFIGGFAADLSFTKGFSVPPPEWYVDYLLPFGLPFSLGAYLVTPDPNLTGFGLRAAYHVDLDNDATDLYVLYVFDFGFLRNDILRRYGDRAQEIHFYDFRAGVRRRFGRFICLGIETGFKLQSLRFGLAVKLY